MLDDLLPVRSLGRAAHDPEKRVALEKWARKLREIVRANRGQKVVSFRSYGCIGHSEKEDLRNLQVSGLLDKREAAGGPSQLDPCLPDTTDKSGAGLRMPPPNRKAPERGRYRGLSSGAS